MKKLVVAMSVLFLTTLASAQTHFCLSVNETCCDAGWSYDVETTGAAYTNFRLYYETGTESNQVEVIFIDTGIPQRSWTVCGCGVIEFQYPVNAGHELTLKAKCSGCSLSQCQNSTAIVKIYSKTSGNPCEDSCD